MKVAQNIVSKVTNSQERKNIDSSNRTFHTYVQKQQGKMQSVQLNQLMNEIETQGTRLERSRNLRDLARFKNLVKKFVQEAVDHGMNIKESTSWDMQGYQNTHQIVEEIDKHLMELTDHMVTEEKEGISILSKIGEIKGLLINLYT